MNVTPISKAALREHCLRNVGQALLDFAVEDHPEFSWEAGVDDGTAPLPAADVELGWQNLHWQPTRGGMAENVVLLKLGGDQVLPTSDPADPSVAQPLHSRCNLQLHDWDSKGHIWLGGAL